MNPPASTRNGRSSPCPAPTEAAAISRPKNGTVITNGIHGHESVVCGSAAVKCIAANSNASGTNTAPRTHRAATPMPPARKLLTRISIMMTCALYGVGTRCSAW